MNPLFFALSALLALAAVHAVPAGQPSGAPTPCGYTCAPADMSDFPLGETSNDGTTLWCSYPAVPGEDPNDFYCNYHSGTGGLMLDNDAGLCHGTATSSCAQPARRRSPLPQAPALPIAAPVARAPKPDEMKVRAMLKRRQVQVEA